MHQLQQHAQHISALLESPNELKNELQIFDEWQRQAAEDRAAIARSEAFRERVKAAMPNFNAGRFDVVVRDAAKIIAGERDRDDGREGREQVRNDRRVCDFWAQLKPLQRVRVCQALALVYLDDGFSNSIARDLKSSLYYQAALRPNLFNGLLILLARFNFNARTLLLEFHQGSQVIELDILKLAK